MEHWQTIWNSATISQNIRWKVVCLPFINIISSNYNYVKKILEDTGIIVLTYLWQSVIGKYKKKRKLKKK